MCLNQHLTDEHNGFSLLQHYEIKHFFKIKALYKQKKKMYKNTQLVLIYNLNPMIVIASN